MRFKYNNCNKAQREHITDKASFRTPNTKSIEALCKLVGEYYAKGQKFIIVHGAGSYAHIPSMQYALADGIINEEGKVQKAGISLEKAQLTCRRYNQRRGQGTLCRGARTM